MTRQMVLTMCEEKIKNDLGSIDDLPYELANTVANIYYKFLNYTYQGLGEGKIPKEIKREADLSEGLSSYLKSTNKRISDVQKIPEFIGELRKIDKYQTPNKYQAMIELILDILKYEIKDVFYKSGIRRAFERKMKKGKVQEIPNLVDLLDV